MNKLAPSLPTRRFALLGVALSAAIAAAAGHAAPAPIKNIALVHGAFVDGSGWRPVYDILVRDGYNVKLVQEPLTSIEDDVQAAKRTIDTFDGPVVLVGHSYGGTIVTEAGIDPKVKALVYIAAHAPDVGETEAGNGKRFPALAQKPVKTADDFLYLDPARFYRDFAADLPAAQAEFEAQSQMPTAAKVFTTPVQNVAWKTKPSWYMVAQSDRIISPDLERMYAKRAGSHTVEAKGASHSVYESQPQAVARLIEAAANGADTTTASNGGASSNPPDAWAMDTSVYEQ
ncbi:MAG TPA: alpha/beta hydrolase [Dyella sp.]|uniref:alpha/beta hydrolase n=1 Tax=Dyella sp. TaxID=1869338 RepID=UPI002F95FC86